MFTIEPNPTFPATLTITGQGREQKLKVVFRHIPTSEHAAMMDQVSKGELATADAVLRVVESWEADAELSRESLQRLHEAQPGADYAILLGYIDAKRVARKGN